MSKAATADILMDSISISSRVSEALMDVIKGIDVSILADQSNDPDLIACRKQVKVILSLLEPSSKAYKAVKVLEVSLLTAMDKDFNDQTKEVLKGRILPLQERVDEQIESTKALMSRLQEES